MIEAFCALAAVNLLTGYLQVHCWSVPGERQTQKLREKYVRAIVSQEIGWFDVNGPSELSTRVTELAGKVQDGIGRKVGDLIQYLCQFVFGFIVAFYLSAKLAAVLLCVIPLIGGAGAFMINAVTSATNMALEQYAGAGGLGNR